MKNIVITITDEKTNKSITGKTTSMQLWHMRELHNKDGLMVMYNQLVEELDKEIKL